MRYRFLLLTLLLFSFSFSQKYNKAYLQKKNQEIRQEIEKLNKQLSEVKKESASSLLYFNQLSEKIDARSQLVKNTYREKRFIEDDIYLKQLEINKLRRELEQLRKEYAEVLVNSYKNKSVQNKLLFVITAKDLGQALRRIKYLDKYGEYQKNKSQEIIDKQKKIELSIKQKEKSKQEKVNLLKQQEVEKKKLESERKEKEQIVLKYKKDENGILTKLKEKQRTATALERDIEKAIREEIAIAKAKREAELKKKREEEAKRKAEEAKRLAEEKAKREAEELARKKAEEEAKRIAEKNKTTVVPTPKKEVTTPKIIAKKEETKVVKEEKTEAIKKEEVSNVVDMEVVSERFEANKNKLPWPVERGNVVSKFGSYPHPIIPNITMNNAGIEIATDKGAQSRAVFDGEVFKIQSIPGGNKAVMVSHGDYFTIYTNLKDVFVKAGDRVRIKQSLGTIYTDDLGNTLAGFQVWKGVQKIDPALWLSNM
ncbi:MAG: peptidoglycan DD-metalloendopeptidase family protein [Flavobacteriales bacterium]|nr:peptidoglycan DD-metalloendopeptidase family protein [Flavobacteriales bacterium]